MPIHDKDFRLMTESIYGVGNQFKEMSISLDKLNEQLQSFKIPQQMLGEPGPRMEVTFSTTHHTFNGIEIIEDPSMVDFVEDWSACRSPSRAKRRLKLGFPQHMVRRAVPKPGVYMIDGRAIMHPEIARQMRERIAKMAEEKLYGK